MKFTKWRSMFRREEYGSPVFNPNFPTFTWWQLHIHDKVPSSSGSRTHSFSFLNLINGTVEAVTSWSIFLFLRYKMDNRQFWNCLPWELWSNFLVLWIPSCSFHVKTMHKYSIFRPFFDFCLTNSLHNSDIEGQFFSSDRIFSTVILKNSSKEWMRNKEGVHPE